MNDTPRPRVRPPSVWRPRVENPAHRYDPTFAEDGAPEIIDWLGGEGFFERTWDRRWAVVEATDGGVDWEAEFVALAERLAPDGRLEFVTETAMGSLEPHECAQILARASERIVRLRSAQTQSERLADWHDGFSRLFRCAVTSSVYLNGIGAPGFAPHIDAHHVFALQLTGTKTWDIAAPNEASPMSRFEPIDVGSLDDADRVVVHAGQLLYMPPGWRHRARCTEGISIHVTFGVHAPRVLDALEVLCEQLALDDAALRTTISGRTGPDGIHWTIDPAIVRETLHRLAAAAFPDRLELHDGTPISVKA